jgi:tight adherence protein C
MCVNAGLDFPGALHAITHHADKSDLVGQELIRVLAALQLGRTRKQALSELERRVPIEAIRSFVRELTQAEEKGTPIAEALSAQARINRGERSIAAEEAAARAGVLMILPMMILLGCIILMLMGPFIVGGLGL